MIVLDPSFLIGFYNVDEASFQSVLVNAALDEGFREILAIQLAE